MRSNRHHLSTKREGSTIFYLPKPLLTFGYGSLLILATLGNLVADQPPSPVGAPDAEPLPDTSAVPANSQTPDNSQAPDNSQTPVNPQGPNNPLLPQPVSNLYLPLSSSSSNVQSPQITTPSLYITGVNNVSQVATNAALTQAFSQQTASGFYSEQGMSYSNPPIEQIRLGPVDLKAAISTNVVSDDNLRTGQTGEGRSDTSYGVTPAILLEYGTQEGQKGYASVVYAPTLTRFFHESDQNSFDQNAALNVQYPFQKLSLNFSEAYSQSTGINTDINSRTTQTSSTTTFGGNYDIDDKLSFSSNVQETITSFAGGGGEGDTTSSVNSSLSYHLSEKMTLSSSLNGGVDKPQDASQQTFEQALLGLNYQPTEKIGLFAQAGAEFRQGSQENSGNQTGQGGDETNPIFSAGVGYAPFDSTNLSVNANQSVYSSSAISGQTVVSTGVGFAATQRFLQRFFLNFSFDYTHNDNQSGTGSTAQSNGISTTGGSQDNLVYRPSLSVAPTAWTSLAIYYQYLDNKSSTPGETYHDNQMGVSASAQF